MGEVTIDQLADDQLGRIREIDRSEFAAVVYVQDGVRLRAVPAALEIPAWSEREVEATCDWLRGKLAGGGVALGAFDGGGLVAMAALSGAPVGDRLELAFLYVSSEHRRGGIGRRLMDAIVDRALARGARSLYVSATETGSAVGFYLAYGCRPLAVADPEQLRLEPNDIHMAFEIAETDRGGRPGSS